MNIETSHTARFMRNNCYHYLAGNIMLEEKDVDSMPVFVHEYLHHFHNASTVLGAERYNYFVQILSHFSRLAAKVDVIQFPLKDWDADTMPEVAHELHEIAEHFRMWEYLDRAPYPDLSFARPTRLPSDQLFSLCGITVSDEMAEDIRFPAVAVDDGSNSSYHPIGGFAISEAASFCLEQLWREVPFPHNYLLSDHERFHYHFTAYIASTIFDTPATIYLAGYLMADLAVSIATPSYGFRVVIARFMGEADAAWGLDELVAWHQKVLADYAEVISNSTDLELEMLDKVMEELEGFTSEGIVRIREHARKIGEGLRLRQANPGLALELLPQKGKAIESLIRDFPPTLIQIKKDGKISEHSHTKDSYSEYLAFDLLTRFFFEAYYGDDDSPTPMQSVFLPNEWKAVGNGLFEIQLDPALNPNAEILEELLVNLCMDGKLIRR